MAARFWTAVLAFHAVMLPVSFLIGRRVARGLAADEGLSARQLSSATALFTLAAVGTGAVASAWAPMPGFTLLRLWCQALFGELVVACACLAVAALRWSRLLPGAGFATAAAALIAVYWQAYHREPEQLEVRRHELSFVAAHQRGGQIRIAHVTDIQSAHVAAHEERALRVVLQERPDAIVFTGDYVQPRTSPDALPARALALRLNELVRRMGLRAPVGVFATEGDIGVGCAEVFAETGVRCLVDECTLVTTAGPRLAIAGLATRLSRGRDAAGVRAVVDSCPPADHVIVAGHRPDFVKTVAGHPRVRLVLAGHTHGGQVVLPLFGPPLTLTRLPRRYAGGLNDYAGVSLHVSRGVGMERGTAPQIRFLCPPEVCLLDVSY